MADKFSLVKNPIGYYEVNPKPTIDELNEHYSKKYYQENKGCYQQKYSDEELKYFNVGAKLALKTVQRFSKCPQQKLLDLGCGEGFFAKYLSDNGWSVECVDFSNDGLKQHNPSLLPYFIQGDLLTYLDSADEIEQFDLINLDNVLEHVLDPVELLRKLKSNMSCNTVLRVEVPNDFSRFQSLLIEKGYTEETWVNYLEHLSYFNRDSLVTLLETEGFHILSLQADFPIEQFMLSEHSNYWKDRSLGRSAHLSRVMVTNYMADTNLDRMIDYQEAAADLEFGRLLTAYVVLEQ